MYFMQNMGALPILKKIWDKKTYKSSEKATGVSHKS